MSLVPTNRLRFVEREGLAPSPMPTPLGGSPEKRRYKILQQWWISWEGSDPPVDGEWRDVPVETE